MAQTHIRKGTFMHRLTDGSFQVGSVAEHTVMFNDLTAREVEWIKSLRAEESAQERRTRRIADEPKVNLTERQVEILALLSAAGLLGPDEDPLSRLRIRVVGLDRVGVLLARLLARSGVRRLELRDTTRVDSAVEDYFSDDAKGLIKDRHLRKEFRERYGLVSGRLSNPDLVISCNSRVWDHADAGLLLSQDLNHLPITVDDRSIRVGPLIAPGTTACAVCVDMHLRDRAPAWAETHLALERHDPVVPSHALAMSAAGLAVNMVDSIARGIPLMPPQPASPETSAGPVASPGSMPSYSWRITPSGVETEVWFAHPECACTARTPQLPAERAS